MHVVLSTIGIKGKIKKALGKKEESLRPGVNIAPLMSQTLIHQLGSLQHMSGAVFGTDLGNY